MAEGPRYHLKRGRMPRLVDQVAPASRAYALSDVLPTFFADGRIFAEYQVLMPLPDKAESYLDASLAVAPGWEAHVELARLSERIGRTDDANRHYRAAAELSRR